MLRLIGALAGPLRAADATTAPHAPSDLIQLEAAAPCLDDAQLESRVHSASQQPIPADLRVRIHSGVDGTLVFSISRGSQQIASRSFSADTGDCDAYADALALSIAVGLDAIMLPEPPAALVERASAPANDRQSQQAPWLHLWGGAGLTTGPIQNVSPTTRLGLASSFGLAIDGSVGAEMAWPIGVPIAGGTARSHLLTAFGEACYRPTRSGQVSFLACGAVHWGVLRAYGEGFARQDAGLGSWGAVGGGPSVEYATKTAVVFRLSVRSMWAFARPKVVVASPQGEWVAQLQTSQFAWGLALGVGYPLL